MSPKPMTETSSGNVLAEFAKSLNGADRGNVIESKERGEDFAAFEELASDVVADLRGWRIIVELRGQLFPNFDAEMAGDTMQCAPTCFRIGTEVLSLDEGDALEPQFLQVIESEVGGKIVVQNDVGYTRSFLVARDGYEGQHASFVAYGIDGDDSFDGSLLQEKGIFFEEIFAVAVAHNKVKIAFLERMIFDPGHHQRGIAFADFRNDDANGEAALLTQRTSHEVGAIVE
jgi:hypothetical protein